MPQKPVNDWQTVDDWEPVSQPSTKSLWQGLSEPLWEGPSRFAQSVSDYITTPRLEESRPWAMVKGFAGGALEGIGNLVSGLTSPINLATTAATSGSSAAMKAGLSTIAKLAGYGARGIGGLAAAHGLGEVGSGLMNEDISRIGTGAVEMAGGALGMKASTSPKMKIATEIAPIEETKPGFFDRMPSEKTPAKSTIPPKPTTEAIATGTDYIDKFEGYRKVPVGTRYSIKPETLSRRKLADAIKLGFEYEGIDDKTGKIILKKTKPSPEVNVPISPEIEQRAWQDAINIPRTIMASMDMSAPLRQGIGLINKKQFWTSLPAMFKAWGSEEGYNSIMQAIKDDPIFKKRATARGQLRPSIAEEAGLAITDLSSMAKREESMLSSLAEKVPGVRKSNRAYTAYLNKLRADTFKQMISDFGAYSSLDARNNLPLIKDIATFVNNASGRGSLGKLEPSAQTLSSVLFSPRLIASRLGIMGRGARGLFDPNVYMSQAPNIRREYLKSLFSIAATAGTFTQLARLAGATVESDPASSDFGKVKIGNTRIDPYGGFQQYIVAAQRLMPKLDLSSIGLGEIGGKMKSTTTGREYDLINPQYGQSSQADVLLRFVRSKTNPIINFAWGLLGGQKEIGGKPMDFTTLNPAENAVLQRITPMLAQDIYDLIKDETTPPEAKALATFLATFGMGSQTYGGLQ